MAEIGKVYTGLQFKELVPGKLVKLTKDNEKHNDYQFKKGLNIDIIPFNPTDSCMPGGFYFCTVEDIPKWLRYNNNTMIWQREVILPDDARVYVEKDKFKADMKNYPFNSEKMCEEFLTKFNEVVKSKNNHAKNKLNLSSYIFLLKNKFLKNVRRNWIVKLKTLIKSKVKK